MKPHGRLVYTRGPVIFTLEAIGAVTGLLALVSLVLVLVGGSVLYQNIQQEREDSARNTCYAIRALTLAAYPSRYQTQAKNALRKAGLGDCNLAAKRVTRSVRK